MKVYVDELPKNCDSCVIYKYYLGCCLTEFSRTTPKTERHNKCPLKSLVEYDKQVAEEIKSATLKKEKILKGKKAR